ncbi:MAG: type II toxin-antitoxin system ParD family antitoxin [Ignavibacteriales bacterium]
MKIDLPPRLEKMINDKVSAGLYPDAAEVVGEALELMQMRDLKLQRLREAIAESRASYRAGEYIEIESQEDIEALFDA